MSLQIKNNKVFFRKYPDLLLLCQNRQEEWVSPETAYHLYERGWKWVDQSNLKNNEAQLIEELIERFGDMNV